MICKTFSREPWNDNWADAGQLHAYILDLIGNRNSLSLGLYQDSGALIGVSLGRIKHWYEGNSYWIDDLAIAPEMQGQGCGSQFIALIERYARSHNIAEIVLFTERDIPAYHFYKKNGFAERSERVFFEKRLK